MTPRMRATIPSSRLRDSADTARVQPDRINSHNNIEPSWPPHTAPMRYTRGRAELECRATYNTEKSLPMNDAVRQMKAKATNKNWQYAARSEEQKSELQ